MLPTVTEDEEGLRNLHSGLEQIQPGLHTIQILTVNPDGDHELRWLLLSSKANAFRQAVQDFTKHKIMAGKAVRTLAYDDNEDSLGSYWWWEPERPKQRR